MTQPTLELRVVNLIVKDMAATVAFYRRLGFDIPGDTTQAHLDVHLPNGTILAWDTEELQRSLDRKYERRPGTGYGVTIEFWLPDRDSVDAKYVELAEAGYHGRADPFDASWGPRYALIDDPDGNTIAISSPFTPPDITL